MTVLRRFAVVLATVVISTLSVTSAGSADIGIFGSVFYGANYASSNGTWTEACDMEADGNGVFGRYETSNAGTVDIPDGNGSAGGCGNATFTKVIRFRVCEKQPFDTECSSWAKP
jgi:hypothetical protein